MSSSDEFVKLVNQPASISLNNLKTSDFFFDGQNIHQVISVPKGFNEKEFQIACVNLQSGYVVFLPYDTLVMRVAVKVTWSLK